MDFQLNLAIETVAQARPEEPLVVAPTTSLREVLQQLQSYCRGSVLVCSADGSLQGILTERDIVRLLADAVDLSVTMQDVMICHPETLTSADTVATAISRMSQGGYRRLPVVDQAGHPIGVLGVSRILEYLVEHFPQVVYTLPPKPHHAVQEREGA